MNYDALAELLFKDIDTTPADIEAMYPERALPEGAMVTRIAPSPTGFVHFGNLFPAITSERMAHQSGGIFYLRIEDTDAKREVPGAVDIILKAFTSFGLNFDEGATVDGDNGYYGPYRQRQREKIYKTYAKELVKQGKAYPCFCTEEDLAIAHAKQEALKCNFGYFGQWAKCRDKSFEEIKQLIDEGKSYVLRFRSEGSSENKIKHRDLVKGELEITENDIDHVLLKSDGIPTYHFAHVVDDHLMGTTHVVRGDEWLSTLPLHLQLFRAMGWKAPKYLHISPLMKSEGDSKRKLSKRKDPEAALTFYAKEGYPSDAVYEYILTLLNSGYEQWRMTNPDKDAREYPFQYKKMSVSGALFDIVKLYDVSKNYVSRLTADEVYEAVKDWAKEYNPSFYELFTKDKKFSVDILSIGRGGKKPRKDFGVWSEVPSYMDFFFDEIFNPTLEYDENLSKENIKAVLKSYIEVYDDNDDNNAWFEKIREMSEKLGFSGDVKKYKESPESYIGHVGDVSMVLRIAVCGRTNSPDMYAVFKILGKDKVIERIKDAYEKLN
ncbi:MAG: glutamate--tRNA ligase [Bacillota bacterium]|nr:glutamate--tRNA ligase [Bacillota bacterium]